MCSYAAEDKQKFCPGCGSSLADAIQPGAAPTFVTDARIPSPVDAPDGAGSDHSGGYSGTSGSDHTGAYDGHYAYDNASGVTPDKLVLQPIVAALLSVFILNGLGQMINGQIGKGLLLLGLQVVLGTITCGISVLPGYIVIGIDAYKCAQALQEGKTIGKWGFFGS
jgi:TM2 domain-containing membrane protein YozV